MDSQPLFDYATRSNRLQLICKMPVASTMQFLHQRFLIDFSRNPYFQPATDQGESTAGPGVAAPS